MAEIIRKASSKATAASLLMLISTPFVTGCSSLSQSDETQKETDTATLDSSDEVADSTISSSDGSASLQLVLDTHNCVGCQKCVRIAPDNFTMQGDTDKAVVTSQKNITSESVKDAMSACPKDAIKLVKA